ncbi:hypothetical protein QWY20_18250 [Alkalimonas sp. MEB108]|uniref:Uncharacterized protein n=1 Tax=Alkalimonas cellulosilytica TaxID=3058395 RepID=A0ABU7JA23_9GAMM|nr:hypothetical protein [Alkalimonas sp. MEB108]MEE2003391.1 hypothetical protein [Alkalimonas sp. MEB108]
MLSGYEIAMLVTIGASFVFMMWRLLRALEQEKREKFEKQQRSSEQTDEPSKDEPLSSAQRDPSERRNDQGL